VRMVDVTLVVADDAAPHRWEASAPAGAARPATAAERLPGAPAARVMRVPMVDTAHHLAWLEARLPSPVLRRRLATLDEGFDFAPVVVACPGFAARELLADPSVTAIRGVVVEVAPRTGVAVPALLDERGPRPTYVLPRRDGTVLLGGRVDVGDERRVADPTEVADVLARCEALAPQLAGATVVAARAGLRPGRPTVRVEELTHPRGRLVVDYGHGGSGWTLAPGCARDVAALVAA
jgi:D-amino-acid oxidase